MLYNFSIKLTQIGARMNKMAVRAGTTILLVVFMACVSSSSVYANPLTAASSTVTVAGQSGDMDFTAIPLDAGSLSGIQSVDGMTYPSGFPAKEAQFIGQGVRVEGHSYGKATACFAFRSSAEGWTGNVYRWNGTKWVKLVTTVNNGGEGTPTACADFFGNGEFALIGAATNVAAAGLKTYPDCGTYIYQSPDIQLTAWPVQSLVAWGASSATIGITFATFIVTDGGVTTTMTPDIKVEAWLVEIGPDGVVLPGITHGIGLSSALTGYTDNLLTYDVVSSDPYHFRIRYVINDVCELVKDY
jgi:hypothetical protein